MIGLKLVYVLAFLLQEPSFTDRVVFMMEKKDRKVFSKLLEMACGLNYLIKMCELVAHNSTLFARVLDDLYDYFGDRLHSFVEDSGVIANEGVVDWALGGIYRPYWDPNDVDEKADGMFCQVCHVNNLELAVVP